jgi:hypothetical protein
MRSGRAPFQHDDPHLAQDTEPWVFNAAVDRFLASVDRDAWQPHDPREVSTTGMR